jgi:metal-responsive CopG/Arc/MetJ family transcriptional regulator
MARKQLPKEEKKQKLTISINENMLNKLKSIAEKQKMSLSQIIENILKEK